MSDGGKILLKTENLKELLIWSVNVPPTQLQGSKWRPGPSGKIRWRFTLKNIRNNLLLVEKKQITLFCTIKQHNLKPGRSTQACSNLLNSESFTGLWGELDCITAGTPRSTGDLTVSKQMIKVSLWETTTDADLTVGEHTMLEKREREEEGGVSHRLHGDRNKRCTPKDKQTDASMETG